MSRTDCPTARRKVELRRRVERGPQPLSTWTTSRCIDPSTLRRPATAHRPRAFDRDSALGALARRALAALDLKLRESMQEELKRLQRELQLTFVFVTHDQAEAFAMSDRVAVMEAGTLVQVGTPEEKRSSSHDALRDDLRGPRQFHTGLARGGRDYDSARWRGVETVE